MASPQWHLRDDATGGDCTAFGSWDSATKTCTLTTDVEGRIFFDADGLVLDGNGHRIAQGSQGPCLSFDGTYRWCTIYANGRTGLTMKNAVIVQADGVWLENSPGATISNNTFEAPGHVVHLYRSSGSSVSENVVRPQSESCGCIYTLESTELVISDNEIPGPGYTGEPSIDVIYGDRSTISGNEVGGGGIRLRHASGSTVTGNTATGSNAIVLEDSNGATVSGNAATSKASWIIPGGGCFALTFCRAIYLLRSTDATISGNTATAVGRPGYALQLDASPRASVAGNTLYGNDFGLLIYDNSGSSSASGNVVSAGGYGRSGIGVGVKISASSVVNGNTISSNDAGVWLFESSATVISENLITSTSSIGVVTSSSEGVQVLGNRISSYLSGVHVSQYGSSPHMVDGNTIAMLSSPGDSDVTIGINVQGSGRIANNTVTVNQGTGILLAGCAGTYENNTVTVTMWRGMWVGGVCPEGRDVIRRNTVSVAYGDGIMPSGNYNTIVENKVTATNYGIAIPNRQGNTIHGNDIRGARWGIYLGDYGSSNVVSYNVVSDGETGIRNGGEMSYNIIKGNLIARNYVGLYFTWRLYYHQVYYNCFLDNTYQLSRYEDRFYQNVWDDGGVNPSQGTPTASPWGNYWSDYHGLDDGSGGRPMGDGVGDTRLPHQFYDDYPLMSPNMPNYGRVCTGNAAPSITSLSASTASEGQPTVFAAIATDPENDALTYSFDFDGDGVFDSTGPSNTATFTWGDDHAGAALVRVSDGDQTSEAETEVRVGNADPVVEVGDGPAVEGQPLVVSYRVRDPGSDDLTVTIEWGDGSAPEQQRWQLGPEPDPHESTDVNPRDVTGTFSHTLGDDATLTATLTVEDDDGGVPTKLLILQVVNGEPRITAQDIGAGVEGGTVDFSATATDPGSDDLTFCWNTDDGHTECRTYPSDGSFPHTATDSGTHVWGDDATYDVVLTVTDDDGGTTTWAQPTRIANVAPTVDVILGASSYPEGTPVGAFSQFMDPGSDDVTLTWDWAMGPTEAHTFLNDGATSDPDKSPWGTYPFGGSDGMVYTYPDSGVFPLTLTGCDDDGGCSSRTVPVFIDNVAPSVQITGPAAGSVYAVGEPVTFSGVFADPGTADVHTAQWMFDSTVLPGTVTEAGGSGAVTDTYAFLVPGVYFVTLVVLDDDGGAGTASTVGELTALVVIYDPSGGFVTGGGWFLSPPGSYALDRTLTGKATFGFVSKYQKGAKVPTGETEFQFKVADLDFHSTAYEWLVVSGPKAQYKGGGTINDVPGYSFLLTAWDGDMPGGGGQDRIRMKIWVTVTGQVVYDSQAGSDDNADPTTVIGGGSIVIHKG